MQWVTSREVAAEAGVYHGGAPRLSTWDDPAYADALNPEYVAAVQEAMKTSRTTVVFREGWKATAWTDWRKTNAWFESPVIASNT